MPTKEEKHNNTTNGGSNSSSSNSNSSSGGGGSASEKHKYCLLCNRNDFTLKPFDSTIEKDVRAIFTVQIKFKENRKVCLQCLFSLKILKQNNYNDCCKDLFENEVYLQELRNKLQRYANRLIDNRKDLPRKTSHEPSNPTLVPKTAEKAQAPSTVSQLTPASVSTPLPLSSAPSTSPFLKSHVNGKPSKLIDPKESKGVERLQIKHNETSDHAACGSPSKGKTQTNHSSKLEDASKSEKKTALTKLDHSFKQKPKDEIKQSNGASKSNKRRSQDDKAIKRDSSNSDDKAKVKINTNGTKSIDIKASPAESKIEMENVNKLQSKLSTDTKKSKDVCPPQVVNQMPSKQQKSCSFDQVILQLGAHSKTRKQKHLTQTPDPTPEPTPALAPEKATPMLQAAQAASDAQTKPEPEPASIKPTEKFEYMVINGMRIEVPEQVLHDSKMFNCVVKINPKQYLKRKLNGTMDACAAPSKKRKKKSVDHEKVELELKQIDLGLSPPPQTSTPRSILQRSDRARTPLSIKKRVKFSMHGGVLLATSEEQPTTEDQPNTIAQETVDKDAQIDIANDANDATNPIEPSKDDGLDNTESQQPKKCLRAARKTATPIAIHVNTSNVEQPLNEVHSEDANKSTHEYSPKASCDHTVSMPVVQEADDQVLESTNIAADYTQTKTDIGECSTEPIKKKRAPYKRRKNALLSTETSTEPEPERESAPLQLDQPAPSSMIETAVLPIEEPIHLPDTPAVQALPEKTFQPVAETLLIRSGKRQRKQTHKLKKSNVNYDIEIVDLDDIKRNIIIDEIAESTPIPPKPIDDGAEDDVELVPEYDPLAIETVHVAPVPRPGPKSALRKFRRQAHSLDSTENLLSVPSLNPGSENQSQSDCRSEPPTSMTAITPIPTPTAIATPDSLPTLASISPLKSTLHEIASPDKPKAMTSAQVTISHENPLILKISNGKVVQKDDTSPPITPISAKNPIETHSRCRGRPPKKKTLQVDTGVELLSPPEPNAPSIERTKRKAGPLSKRMNEDIVHSEPIPSTNIENVAEAASTVEQTSQTDERVFRAYVLVDKIPPTDNSNANEETNMQMNFGLSSQYSPISDFTSDASPAAMPQPGEGIQFTIEPISPVTTYYPQTTTFHAINGCNGGGTTNLLVANVENIENEPQAINILREYTNDRVMDEDFGNAVIDGVFEMQETSICENVEATNMPIITDNTGTIIGFESPATVDSTTSGYSSATATSSVYLVDAQTLNHSIEVNGFSDFNMQLETFPFIPQSDIIDILGKTNDCSEPMNMENISLDAVANASDTRTYYLTDEHAININSINTINTVATVTQALPTLTLFRTKASVKQIDPPPIHLFADVHGIVQAHGPPQGHTSGIPNEISAKMLRTDNPILNAVISSNEESAIEMQDSNEAFAMTVDSMVTSSDAVAAAHRRPGLNVIFSTPSKRNNVYLSNENMIDDFLSENHQTFLNPDNFPTTTTTEEPHLDFLRWESN